MAFDPNNWLDIWNILKWELFGDLYLAIFSLVLIILIICARFNLDHRLTTLILVLFALVVSGMELVATEMIYAYTVLIIGGISYYLYSQAFKRG